MQQHENYQCNEPECGMIIAIRVASATDPEAPTHHGMPMSLVPALPSTRTAGGRQPRGPRTNYQVGTDELQRRFHR